MAALQATTDANFADKVSSGLTLVDFWAEWCGPCQVMLPRLEELAKNLDTKIVIAKHNVDTDPNTPSQYKIMSIPTMILFKDGQVVEKWVGVQDRATLEAQIEKHL